MNKADMKFYHKNRVVLTSAQQIATETWSYVDSAIFTAYGSDRQTSSGLMGWSIYKYFSDSYQGWPVFEELQKLYLKRGSGNNPLEPIKSQIKFVIDLKSHYSRNDFRRESYSKEVRLAFWQIAQLLQNIQQEIYQALLDHQEVENNEMG